MPNPPSTGLPHAASYTVNGDGTVKDNVTNLVWQQEVPTDFCTWEEANAFCASLPLAGGGWRLPTRIELVSLVDFTQRSPAIDTSAFPNTPPNAFWSWSAVVGPSGLAWRVNFLNGCTEYKYVLDSSYVRCVR
jgi:hypothetical protein